MIKQGSEDPITLTFNEDMSEIKAFIAELISRGKTIKKYGLDDIIINDNQIELPLTQEETLAFPYGEMYLEVEWRDADGIKFQADQEKIYVAPRHIKELI